MNEEIKEIPQPDIVTLGDQRSTLLGLPSQECSFPLNDTDKGIIEKMDSILEELGGGAAGIAAVQVGYPKRIFMLSLLEGRETFINPTVISRSKESSNREEGCLSVPGAVFKIKRPKSVTVKYTNILEEEVERQFTGLWAKAICHEIDHLNGTLITNHFEETLTKYTPRTKYGMKKSPAQIKALAKRRKKRKTTGR